MSIHVVKSGLLSTIQDLGRHGYQHLGVVPCGAMDQVSHCMANALVGNNHANATLECTLIGPDLVFEEDSLVALYGARFESKAGRLPHNRPVLVPAGSTISIGSAVYGSRAYLAIAGGFAVPEVLGSRSTYMPGGFGGLRGRPICLGDDLPTVDDLASLSARRFGHLKERTASQTIRTVRWSVPALSVPGRGVLAVRAMKGRHHAQFSKASQDALFSAAWRISPNSNRMGYRLEGARLERRRPVEVLSEPTCLGTVQVPNDGNPIVLMADHQTTGGYPKIAEVASVDVPRLSQMAPGGTIRFVSCSLEHAQESEDEMLGQLEAARDSVRSMFGGAT
jgi:biotin-dependent carboxylase-like uncharacterized protein